jgi:protein-S-isoprenylcysteine O-methyltransferase Ste14
VLIIRGLIGSVFKLGLFASLLLIPAGTWHWPRAIQFLCAYAIVLIVATVWLAKAAPSSLEARLEPAISAKQPVADRFATAFIGVAVAAWMVFIPLDVFRWHLLPAPSFGMSVFGAMLGAAGFAVLLAALYQNAFATPVVRDQSERGHTLVDAGLYGRVRHPFYTGFLIFLFGLALWLESYAAALALPVVLASLVVRMSVEEKTLRETLPGYVQYMERVRYRLLPGVW